MTALQYFYRRRANLSPSDWTIQELEVIDKGHKEGTTISQMLPDLPGRKWAEVFSEALGRRQIGSLYTSFRGWAWTQAEDARLKGIDWARIHPDDICYRVRNRDFTRIRERASHFGWIKASGKLPRTRWKAEEDYIIKEGVYCRNNIIKIANKLPGRTFEAVWQRAEKLGERIKELYSQEEYVRLEEAIYGTYGSLYVPPGALLLVCRRPTPPRPKRSKKNLASESEASGSSVDASSASDEPLKIKRYMFEPKICRSTR